MGMKGDESASFLLKLMLMLLLTNMHNGNGNSTSFALPSLIFLMATTAPVCKCRSFQGPTLKAVVPKHAAQLYSTAAKHPSSEDGRMVRDMVSMYLLVNSTEDNSERSFSESFAFDILVHICFPTSLKISLG